MAELTEFAKDPSAVLDYVWDWSAWLGADTISTHTVTAATGLTVTSATHTNTAVTVWLSGGSAGTNYRVTCRIVTVGGRTDERTSTVRVRER